LYSTLEVFFYSCNTYDPRLQGQVQLAHLIMHEFKIIELYELWLHKIEQLFGRQNPNLFIGANSHVVYKHQFLKISEVLSTGILKIDKQPFWVETNQDNSRVLTDDQKRIE